MSRPENKDMITPATPAELNAVVGRVGELMTRALTTAGLIDPHGEMPLSLSAPMDLTALRKSRIYRGFDTGQILYSPPVLGWEMEPDEASATLPASVSAQFTSQLIGHPKSYRSHDLVLIPSTEGRPLPTVSASDTTVAADILPGNTRYTEADLKHGAERLAANRQKIAAEVEAEDAMNDLLGYDPSLLMRAEVKDLAKIAVASIRPDTVQIEAH